MKVNRMLPVAMLRALIFGLLLLVLTGNSVLGDHAPVYLDGSVNLVKHHLQVLQSSEDVDAAEILSSLDALQDPSILLPALKSNAKNDTSLCLALLIRVFEVGWPVVDAFAKPPSGILKGDILWLGAYDECVSSRYSGQNITIQGQYCTAVKQMPPNGGLTIPKLTIGLCLPDACGVVGANELVEKVNSIIPLNVSVSECQPLKNPVPDSPAIVVITLFSIIGAVVIIASLYDEYLHQISSIEQKSATTQNSVAKMESAEDSPLLENNVRSDYMGSAGDEDGEVRHTQQITHADEDVPLILTRQRDQVKNNSIVIKCLLAFSVRGNGAKLLSTTSSGEGVLSCIHGIRFFSMTWVILGHTFILGASLAANPLDIVGFTKDLAFAPILAGTLSVDTFFLLSGTLVSYLLLRELRSRGGVLKFNWALFYFHRFWRLSPSYFLLLAFFTTVFKYLGDGPIWGHDILSGSCNETWWGNILYIQNVAIPSEKQCFAWSWYLACDMQFFVVSPLFIIPLFKFNWAGIPFALLGFIGSCISTGVLTYMKNYPADISMIVSGKNFSFTGNDFAREVYFAPWSRISVYLVGIILGFILFKNSARSIRLPKVVVIAGWLVAAGLCISVTYGLSLAKIPEGHILSDSVNAFYASVFRSVWAIGVSWVIFACVTGNGGYVNTFLSWSPLAVLSRLTYMAYLIHPMIMTWYWYNLRAPFIATYSTEVWQFFGFLLSSYGAAVIVSLLLESPMISLERVLWRRK